MMMAADEPCGQGCVRLVSRGSRGTEVACVVPFPAIRSRSYSIECQGYPRAVSEERVECELAGVRMGGGVARMT